METLKEIIPKINSIKTNIDGSKKSYGNLNLLDLYNIAEPKLGEICEKYKITNFELPKISGYNSLVIYAANNQSKFAIKIFVISKKDIENFNTIYKLISENLISPKIYYDENIDINSKKYIVKITVTEMLILFSEFKWDSLYKMKNSILSFIEKTLKLHSLGYVHNDIKYENLGMDKDGTIYLFDFDNFSEICKTSCSKLLSSTVCHPPDILVQASISIGLGNQIIDLFSICAIILGDIIGINFWAFNNKQLYEKNQQLSNFKRNRIHDTINKKIYSKFKDPCLSKFWFSLVNFFHLVFQKNNQIKNKRAFTRRAKKLIARMKDDMNK
jgi:serine/threonine protein kinase